MFQTLPNNTKVYNCLKYSLNVITDNIEMLVNARSSRELYTSYYPKTKEILAKIYPQVLKTQCFNDNNLDFSQEVCDTELGHLFEHILIQKMTEIQHLRGVHAEFEGVTSWNWEHIANNKFEITISITEADHPTLLEALSPTIEIFNLVLESNS